MKNITIRCECGQRVLSRDVLRTDLYERPNGKDYVYVKFRCRHCKQIGESFVPEQQFNWGIFESPKDEMSDQERECFEEKEAISSADIVDLHQFLKDEKASHFSVLTKTLPEQAAPPRPLTGKTGKSPTEKKTGKNRKGLPAHGDASTPEDPFLD